MSAFKKLCLLLMLCFLMAALSSCEFPISDMEIVQYPDKLVYVTGKDTQLDLTGGRIRHCVLWESKSGDSVPMSREYLTEIEENIDFNTPGVYVVRLIQTDDIFCEFAVQVVSPDYFSCSDI